MGIRNKILFFIFAFVLLLNFASAENISLSYPEEVGLGEEFEVTLRLIDFSDDIYDVKIDLLSNGKRVAKILNYDEWKSTYYYVNDIINNSEEKDFLLKIEKEFEEATIDVKMNIDTKQSGEVWKKAIKLLNSDCPNKSCEWCEGK